MAEVTTPVARLASEDFGPKISPKPVYSTWLRQSVLGWGAFAGFLLAMSWLFLALTRLIIWIGDQVPVSWSLSPAIGTILSLFLVLVMITATLLTMADRKWSALMQDRVGPNRARFSIIPGLRDKPLKGIPHIVADVLKMLFKEDFIPEGAVPNRFLFNLAPLLAFAPAFMLFAVVPVGPEVTFFGARFQLQVARVDWGMLYVFALASIAVFGTALAGWTSNNKLALLGGLRASAQLVSYEVTLGLTLVGAFIVFGSLRLDTMALLQGMTEPGLRAAAAFANRAGDFLVRDDSVLFAWLAVLQVFAFIVKMLGVIWVMFVARWAFPRFRYDQIMRLGWKMMLPVSLINVALTAAVFLWGGREGLAWMGLVEWAAILASIALQTQKPAEEHAAHH